MKHLKSYSKLYESQKEPKMQGFLIYNSKGWFTAGVYATFDEFAKTLVDRFSFSIDAEFFPDSDFLDDKIDELDQYEYNDVDFYIWTGLKPRGGEEILAEYDARDIFKTAEQLEKLFTNAKELITAHPNGTPPDPFDLECAARSIENDPSQLEQYYEAYDSETFDKVLQRITSSSPELKVMAAFYAAKRFS
jgi:hypothetical protein